MAAKKKKIEAPGVPEWLVTYGDLMSLLLCFFILLAAFSELKQEREYQKVVDSVKEAFGVPGATGVVRSDLDPQNAPTEESTDIALIGKAVVKADEVPDSNTFGKRKQVQTIREGIMYTIGGHLAFEVGSYELKNSMKERLRSTAQKLKGHNKRIVIRGHAYGEDKHNADHLGYRDLSYERAKVVAQYLEMECGIRGDLLGFEAMGDSEPLEFGRVSAQDQAVNRRVEVIETEVMQGERNPNAKLTTAQVN